MIDTPNSSPFNPCSPAAAACRSLPWQTSATSSPPLLARSTIASITAYIPIGAHATAYHVPSLTTIAAARAARNATNQRTAGVTIARRRRVRRDQAARKGRDDEGGEECQIQRSA